MTTDQYLQKHEKLFINKKKKSTLAGLAKKSENIVGYKKVEAPAKKIGSGGSQPSASPSSTSSTNYDYGNDDDLSEFLNKLFEE